MTKIQKFANFDKFRRRLLGRRLLRDALLM
jgi:hypothetical protein